MLLYIHVRRSECLSRSWEQELCWSYWSCGYTSSVIKQTGTATEKCMSCSHSLPGTGKSIHVATLSQVFNLIWLLWPYERLCWHEERGWNNQRWAGPHLSAPYRSCARLKWPGYLLSTKLLLQIWKLKSLSSESPALPSLRLFLCDSFLWVQLQPGVRRAIRQRENHVSRATSGVTAETSRKPLAGVDSVAGGMGFQAIASTHVMSCFPHFHSSGPFSPWGCLWSHLLHAMLQNHLVQVVPRTIATSWPQTMSSCPEVHILLFFS